MKSSIKNNHVSLAILGLAKNCGNTLPLFFSFLSSLNSVGITYSAIVGENGSIDNSKELLKTKAQRGLLLVEDMGFLSSIPARLERMAVGREHLKYVLETSCVSSDFVCIVDLDNVMETPPTAQQLISALTALQEHSEAFGVSATSRPHYYDLLAYERQGLSFENLPLKITSAKRNPFSYYHFFLNSIYPAQQALTSDTEMICISAFNGMAIYRYSDYCAGTYVTFNSKSICEHVSFNRSLARNTGKYMIISPVISFKTPADHLRRGFFSFWRQRYGKLIGKILR